MNDSIFKNSKMLLAAVLLFACNCLINAQSPIRERILFNADWKFIKDDPKEIVSTDNKGIVKSELDYSVVKNWICANGTDLILPSDSVQATKRPTGNLGEKITYTQSTFNDTDWRKLNLPHDWGIEGAFGYELSGHTGKLPWAGVGWYRKQFNVSKSDADKKIFIDMDGAMSYPMVWLNGQFVGGWAYGYSSFRLDLTPYIKAGAENVLAIRIANPDHSSRWYPGSGIYRNVWLVKTNPIHVAHWGTNITTPKVSSEEALVKLDLSLENQSDKNTKVTASTRIIRFSTENVTPQTISEFETITESILANGKKTISTKAVIMKPALWSTTEPNLYVAITTLKQGDKIVDQYETTFGVRSIKFTADNGFYLNGKRLEIKGVCNHHDLGALGTAFNTRAAERQLEIMKEMGVNALRTSHNMPAPELLDLCDRMGILVMDESFDCWKIGKTANGYNKLFVDWNARDLRALVRRDRNHPSVIQWSIGNEVRELGKPECAIIAGQLRDIVRSEDTMRTVVSGSHNPKAAFDGLQNSIDVYGNNYNLELYPKFKKENPKIPFVGSETSSCVSSRGVYLFPVSDNKLDGRGNFQVSSYDLYAPAWASSPDDEFMTLEKNKFTAGEYVWTGFDYLGEPTPFTADMTNVLNIQDPVERAKMEKELKEFGKIKSPSRSSYFGIVDLCGFKKDRFYIYQAHWLPELPMAHILPHWNWADRIGQNTPVHVYTSGDEAELFLNGKSLGRRKKEQFQYRMRWDSVSYQPGELRVETYKNGNKWATEIVKTTGNSFGISLTPDRNTIKADGTDLSFVTVKIVDKDGLMVPTANNKIKFEISGPGEIVATDNGDATCFESFLGKERSAFNGMALVIVRSKAGQAGNITIKAVSEGLTVGNASILTK
jgi:beta-galactosidase